MMIMLHIGIALASSIVSGIGVVRPTRDLLRASYILIAATAVSGGALLVIQPQQMAHVCMSGLGYLAATSAMALISRRRLAHQAIMTTTE